MEVANPDKKLLPGMTASITVIVKEKDNVLKVPVAAVKFAPARSYLRSIIHRSSDSVKKVYKATLPQKIFSGDENVKEEKKEKMNEGDSMVVWVKKEGMIYPRRVKVGLSDNSFIEVEGSIKEGEEIVTGIVTETVAGQNAKNPFMPQMGGRRRN
jgi:HlyD family secretion protein